MTCGDDLIHDIEHELARVGNVSKYPICIGRHENTWIVTLEIDSPQATFDVETIDPIRELALAKALANMQSQFKRG